MLILYNGIKLSDNLIEFIQTKAIIRQTLLVIGIQKIETEFRSQNMSKN